QGIRMRRRGHRGSAVLLVAGFPGIEAAILFRLRRRTAAGAASALAVAPPVRAGIALELVLLGGSLGFRGEERLPVGDRDLVVIGVNFGEGEETVAVSAIFHERGLQGGLHPGDPGEIDVSLELLLGLRFEIEFFDSVTADYDYSCFLRVRGVDQHLVRHYDVSPRQAGRGALSLDAWRHTALTGRSSECLPGGRPGNTESLRPHACETE